MPERTVRMYFLSGLFLLGIILAIVILWPFAKVVLLSVALSAVLFPVYTAIKRLIKIPWLASLITVLLFLIVLCVPFFLIGTMVFRQVQEISLWVQGQGGLDNITQVFSRSVENLFPQGMINLKESIGSVTAGLAATVSSAFTATLATLFSLFLVLLTMFYFLKDGITWKGILVRTSPLSDDSTAKIMAKLNGAVNGILKGYLFIGAIQGTLMGIGFAIFGIPHAILWGVFAAIASLIPTIGTALVSIPTIIFLLVMDRSGAAIGFALWALALVGSVDNFLNPYIVGRKIDIHPLLVLFSVLGGIALMGPIGILIGPLAISFLYALLSVYRTEIKNA